MTPDDEPRRLPTTVGGLFGAASGRYAARIGFYAALAGIAFALQYVVDVVLPRSDGTAQALGIAVDALVAAAVTIGVANDLAGQPPGWRTIAAAASERWGVVTVAGFVSFLAQLLFMPNVFGSPEETGYGFFVAPIIALWGALSLAQVAAAIEPATSGLQLPLIAFRKALSVSIRMVNLGRLVFYSALLIVPLILQTFLYAALAERAVPNAMFWAQVPIDALSVGPLQALATVFYLDFARRAQRVRR